MKKIILLNAILIYSVYFSNAQNIQKPSINKCGGKMSAFEFKSATSITDLCKVLAEYNIKSYYVFLQTKLSDGINNLNTGNAFNEITKSTFSKAKSGDVVYFDNIIILMPDNSEKKYSGIAIKIE